MQLSRLPFIIHSPEEEHFLWPSLGIQWSCRAYISVTPLRTSMCVHVVVTFTACDGGQRDIPRSEAQLGVASSLYLKSPATCPPTTLQGSVIAAWISSQGSPFPLTEIDSLGWRIIREYQINAFISVMRKQAQREQMAFQ